MKPRDGLRMIKKKRNIFNNYEDGDIIDNLDWLSSRGRADSYTDYINKYERYFKSKSSEAIDMTSFIRNVLEIEDNILSPRFIKYLLDTQTLSVKRIISLDGLVDDYEVEFYRKPYLNENNVMVRPYQEFKTENGELNLVDEYQCIDDLGYHYDELKKAELKAV